MDHLQLEQIVTHAIETLDPGTIVQRFLLVAEVDSATEGKAVWTIPTEGLTSWESLGLLDFAATRERAIVMTSHTED